MFVLTRHSPRIRCSSSIPSLTRGLRRQPKKGVLVRLLEDIPSVGKSGSVHEVPRQVMRSWYFPEQRAEYVLRPMGGFRPGDLRAEEEVVEEEAPPPAPIPDAPAPLPALNLAPYLQQLSTLPPLTFTRRPISSTSPQIFGSVTASNVLQRLSEEFGITLDAGSVSVHMSGRHVELNRVKGLGEAVARIGIAGAGEAEVRVIVVSSDAKDVSPHVGKAEQPEKVAAT